MIRKVAIIIIVVALVIILMAAAPKVWIMDLRSVLPVHPDRVYERRALSQIRQVIIHHTAGPVTQTPEDIARYHTGANHICSAGCPGIAYHYMIDREARVYQVNDLETISYHVSGQNTVSVGICLIGNYDELEPTPQQLAAVVKLIRMLKRKLGVKLEIAGHRDYANKSCPGWNVDVDQIRNKV
ncbi:MAG: peptidoglycan recognition family protein [Saprospiraceae bacterium]